MRCAIALGLDGASCPECYESVEVSGKAERETAASLTRVCKPGTPVVGGGGDQAASAVGNGIVEPGIVSCTLGTSGVVFAHMDKPHYDPAGTRPYVLPRGARQVACNGSDAGRRTQLAMDPKPTHAG